MTKEELKLMIDANIRENGVQEITGSVLNRVLNAVAENFNDRGEYPYMTTGFASNLIGRGESIASEIGFRASGGKSIEDGSARITELQGNAVVWNQLLKESKLVASDATITKTAIGYTIAPNGSAPGLKTDATSGGVTPIVGHKYALLCVKIGGSKGIYLNWGGYNAGLTNPIFSATDSSKVMLTAYSYNETETFTLTTPRLVDLTKMFGSGNEPTTIDEFYNRMPQGINVGAYNEGQLIASNADGIKSVGFNAWDEKWEVGQINVLNGEVQTSTNTIRSKNYCKCLPNETYYAYCGGYTNEYYLGIVWYDENYNYIGYNYGAGRTRQSPSNARYFKLTTNTSSQVNYGTTYNGDICINLVHSGYKNGTYQPYMEFIKTFDYRIKDAFPNGMMPWDKVYNKNGKGYVVKGTGVFEDLSKLNWKKNGSSSTGGVYYADHKGTIILDNISTQLVLSLGKYEISGNAYNYGTPTKNAICLAYGALYISDLDINDAEALKTYLQGVSLYYELATPTIVEYDEPFNLDYEVWDFGTEEVMSDVPSAPIKAMIRYQFNAVDEVRELRQMIATLQTAIANM